MSAMATSDSDQRPKVPINHFPFTLNKLLGFSEIANSHRVPLVNSPAVCGRLSPARRPELLRFVRQLISPHRVTLQFQHLKEFN